MDSFFIKHGLELSKSKEALRTSINAILNMPDTARFEFYKSEAGKKIMKGLELEVENLKPADKDGMTWTKEDIEKTIYRLQQATYEDRQIMLQLLPGPVVSILANQLNKPPYKSYDEWTQPKRTKEKYEPKLLKSKEGGELFKATKKNPEGYQKWLEAIRRARALKHGPQVGDRVRYKDYHHGGVEKVGYIHSSHAYNPPKYNEKGQMEEYGDSIGYEPNPKAGQPGERSDKSRVATGGTSHLITDQPGKFTGGSWHHSDSIIQHLKRRPLNYDQFQHTRDKVKETGEGHPTSLPSKDAIDRYHEEIMNKLGVKKHDKTKDHHSNYDWMYGKDTNFKIGQHNVRLHTQSHKGLTAPHVEHYAQWIHPKDTDESKYQTNTTHEHDPEKLVAAIRSGVAKDQPRIEKRLGKEKAVAGEKAAKLAEFKKLHPEAARMFRQHYGKAGKE